MSGAGGVRIVVNDGLQSEIVDVRERKMWAGVPPITARKIIHEHAVLAVICIDDVFVAHVKVVHELWKIRDESVVPENIAVR